MRVALVTPGYFQALGLPIVRGRAFNDQDREGSTKVAILTEAAARKFFPGENPIGRRIVLGWSNNGDPRGGEVVGVARDFKQSALDRESDPQIFLPFDQAPIGAMSVILRSSADPAAVIAAARAQVREVDPNLPLYKLQTLEDLVSSSVSQPRAGDPAIYMGVAAVLVLVAALACWLPARRAAQTEPQMALRGEG